MSAGQQGDHKSSVRFGKPELHCGVDWRTLLRHFVEQAARIDLTRLPPSRRYLAHGLCLYGLNLRELGQVSTAVDAPGVIYSEARYKFAPPSGPLHISRIMPGMAPGRGEE